MKRATVIDIITNNAGHDGIPALERQRQVDLCELRASEKLSKTLNSINY